MTSSVGQINFGVKVDATGISAELAAALAPALAAAQRRLDRTPLNVRVEIDTTAAVRRAQAALRAANLSIRARVDLDSNITAAKVRQIQTAAAAIRNLNSKSVRVNFTSGITDTAVKQLRDAASAIRRLESKNIRVDFSTNLTDAQTTALSRAASAIRRLESKNIVIRVDIQADEARLRALAEILRDLRDRNVRVDVNADSSGVERLSRNLGSISGYAAGIAAVTAALAALGGAAGAAGGLVGGLALGLASIGPAVAGIAATAVVGFQGIGDAFSALGDMSKNAAADARTQAEAIQSASDALTSAQDSAADASRSLADAQDASAEAAQDVADAYKTAQERLEGYQTSLRESSLDEREAKLNLAEAQKALGEAMRSSDPLDRERALLRVERAEIALGKAQKAGRDLQAEANDALAKGIDQADEVVTARKKQADADQAVADAQRNLARANTAVARAAENLAKAQSGAGTSSEKFADALANLSPNAQAFMLALRALSPEMETFRKGLQDDLFANLGSELSETANVVLPTLRDAMGGVAQELNAAAVNAFQFLRSEEGLRALNATFEASANLLRGLTSGTGELTQGLVDFTATAAPRMEAVGRAIASIGEGFGRALSEAAESGALDVLFQNFASVLTSLGPLLGSVVTSLVTLGNAVMPALVPLFQTLGEVLVGISPALGDLGRIFAQSLTAILPALGDLIAALAEGLQPVLPVLVTLLQALASAITPLIEPFARVAVVVGETLAQTLVALTPALEPLATAFADLITAIAPLVPLIAENLAAVLLALAPALSDVFNALAPVIKSFAEQMRPVIEQIAPILAEVASTIGVALADSIRELAPLLPPLITAWTDLILAIVPIMPELARLAVDLIPPLISIMADLLPVLTKLIEAFTWLAENVLVPVVMPIMRAAADVFQDAFQRIADEVNWITDTVFPKIGEVLGNVKDWFGDAVDWIGRKWAELQDKAAIPVNFVIDTVWNNGLLKAWGSIDSLLGGILPDASPLATIPRRATGGPLSYIHGGSGNGTRDDMLFWGSNNEHVVTSEEVIRAGGHNILFAIRDMILRGVPFTWDNGRIISELGKENLNRYGAKVAQAGFGNVPPEGLFDQLARGPIAKFATGGPLIMPWMHQLKAGHDFARAQNSKPYKWAGPQFVNDSFDCSGFMGSIAAAILGQNPWQRYWATASFAGYPRVGPQGFVKGLTDGSGFAIGVTDNPGGPGGGHTAGELRGIPELGIPAARVESGGALGDVHYGRGTDPNTFASLYGLPIGANGFFQPAPGGTANGPSTGEQSSFLSRTIERVIKAATDPLRDVIRTTIGSPPPGVRAIPVGALDLTERAFINAGSNAIGNLGDLLGGAWQRAQDLGSRVLDFVNPFDSGGVASGVGFMPKNIIAPERVLSPEQTALFETLVLSLQRIASAGLNAAGTATSRVVVDISQASVDALRTTVGAAERDAVVQQVQELERTQSDAAAVAANEAQRQQDMLLGIAARLGGDVLGPIMAAAVNAGTGFLTAVIDGLSKDVVTAVNGTTRAVTEMGGDDLRINPNAAPPAFGQPGSAFDFATAASDAVVQVAQAAQAAFEKVANDVINAALAQTPSRVGNQSRGRLGEDDISGGYLLDFIVKLTGVEIEILDLLENTYEAILEFRGDAYSGFDANGELISDTAALVQRTASSIELARSESERIQKALIKSVIKYLITSVLIPIITAVLGAMITLATTAIGAAIGSAIPLIGTAIGAAVGAAVGAALSGLASVFTSLLAVGAGAALDAFDEGGRAEGLGYMPKRTIKPERVLSPRQTESFERLVDILDSGAFGNRTVQIGSMNVNGRDPAQKSADNLLTLLYA